MDLGGKNHKVRNRNEAFALVEPVKGIVTRREEAEAEKESLLSWKENGEAVAVRRNKGLRRKVHWSDCKGNNLVEVLEFQPSDASDSEDEYLDSCFCNIL